MSRMIIPLLIGLIGCAILVSLGTWQVQRLAWKQGVLAEIDAKIGAVPVVLPEAIDPQTQSYLAVEAGGRFTGEEIHVLASIKQRGAGYRIIAVLETSEGRRILVDRGFIPTERKLEDRATSGVKVQGNLYWPQEVDSYTPDPDKGGNIWFARDVPAMAEALGTEPAMIVARVVSKTSPEVEPFAISSSAIPNDHLQYAITWFSLAAIWFVMTGYLLWRIRQRTV